MEKNDSKGSVKKTSNKSSTTATKKSATKATATSSTSTAKKSATKATATSSTSTAKKSATKATTTSSTKTKTGVSETTAKAKSVNSTSYAQDGASSQMPKYNNSPSSNKAWKVVMVMIVLPIIVIVNLRTCICDSPFGLDETYKGVYCNKNEEGQYEKEIVLVLDGYSKAKNRGRIRCVFDKGSGEHLFFQGYYKMYNEYIEIEGLQDFICEFDTNLDKDKIRTCYAKLVGNRIELTYPLYIGGYSESDSYFHKTIERTDDGYLKFLFM